MKGAARVSVGEGAGVALTPALSQRERGFLWKVAAP